MIRATIVDFFRQVYFTCDIDNLLVQLVGPASKLNQYIYISFQQIDEVLFWSPTKTINFFRCLWLKVIDVKSVRSISYDFVFVLTVMAFYQESLPS
jgi:hypothetical protein